MVVPVHLAQPVCTLQPGLLTVLCVLDVHCAKYINCTICTDYSVSTRHTDYPVCALDVLTVPDVLIVLPTPVVPAVPNVVTILTALYQVY